MRKSQNLKCKKCNGSKHIFDNQKKIWVTCPCLEKDRLNGLLLQSNIPEAYKNITWKWYIEKFPQNKKYKKLYKKITEKILNREQFKWVLLCGAESSGKLGLVSLIIKQLCKRGLSASIETLYHLVNLSFEDREELDSIVNKDFLCLRLGIGGKHSRNPIILEEIFDTRRRKGKYTMFTSRRSINWISVFYDSPTITDKFQNFVSFVDI